jgi:putative PIN family toxin of toxin-antitoxin system
MIRVVLDANVLAPGFSTRVRATSAAALLELWAVEAFELVISEPLLDELRGTFSDPYFVKLLSDDEVEEILARLRHQAIMVELTQVASGIASHPEDDLILSTGLSAGASYLGTRDRQLLKLESYQGMQIVHPADLVEILLREIEPPPRDLS